MEEHSKLSQFLRLCNRMYGILSHCLLFAETKVESVIEYIPYPKTNQMVVFHPMDSPGSIAERIYCSLALLPENVL